MDRSASEIGRCIRLAREGRADVMGELLDAHRNYLRILAVACLHREVRGKADASDVVQETLFKAHQHFHQFRGTTEAEWIAWVRQILVNNITDLHRKYTLAGHDVDRETSLEATMDHSSLMLRKLVLASDPSPSEAAEQHELNIVLANVLAELDPEDSEVVILRNLRELGWNEIGALTNRSPDAARMRWSRALHRLGALLKERLPS